MSAPSFLRPRHIHRNRCKSSGGASKLWIIPSGGDYSIFKVQRAFADFLFLPCVILSLLSVGLLSYIPFSLATINRFQFLFTVCPSSQGRKKQFVKSDCYFLGLLFFGIYGRILKIGFLNPTILFCPLGFFLSLGTPILYHKVTEFAISNCTK